MRTVAAVVVGLLVAAGAWAQMPEESVEFTPTVGFWFGDTLARGVQEGYDFDVTIDDDFAYGFRVGYSFTSNWALTGSFLYERANLITGSGEFLGNTNVLGKIDMTTAEIGFEGAFGHSRLVPIFNLGVGVMNMDPDSANMRSDTNFVAYMGTGFKLFFTPNVAFRFDFRGHAVNVGKNSHEDCDWWGDCSDSEDWIGLRELAIGLSFVF
jgi:hypothetical protein